MIEHFWELIITTPQSTGACTINGNPGYGAPKYCSDQLAAGTLTTVDADYYFTNATKDYFLDGVFRPQCIGNVSVRSPQLSVGNGLASRASAKITLRDFVGKDPNPTSPALVADPRIADNGTYLGKFFERNVIKNKTCKLRAWKVVNGTATLVQELSFLGESAKQNKDSFWELNLQDTLSKVDSQESTYPEIKITTLGFDIGVASTSLTITTNETLSSSDFSYLRIETDVMPVSSAVETSTGVWSVTVARLTSFTLSSSRTFKNLPAEHSAGDEVFLCVDRVGDVAGLIVDVLDNAEIPPSAYNVGDINIELNRYLPHNSGAWLFTESRGTSEFLSLLCESYGIDVLSKGGNEVVVFANSPWVDSNRTIKPGYDYDYYSLDWRYKESMRYTRFYMAYNKIKIGNEDDDRFYTKVVGGRNLQQEGNLLFGGKKVYSAENSIFYGDSLQDEESAETTAARFVQRWQDPIEVKIYMDEEQLIRNGRIEVGTVVAIEDPRIIGGDGLPKIFRAQAMSVELDNKPEGRFYNVTLLSYIPSTASAASTPIYISDSSDVNLWTLASSPTSVVNRTFIIDSLAMFQGTSPQTITTGTGWASGSVINIVVSGSSTLDASGGAGGAGGDTLFINETSTWQPQNGQDGGNGGDVFIVQSDGVTVNLYLGGVRNINSVNYTCDGVIRSAGGGDSGFDASVNIAGNGGNSGLGSPIGNAGRGGIASYDSGSGTGGVNGSQGATGVNSYGVNGTQNGTNTAGLAGNAILDTSTGSTINVYTDGDSSRYVRNSTETNYTAD